MGACLAIGLCECTACLACACCQKTLNGMLGGATRFGHVLVIATVFSLSAIFGIQYPQDINGYKSYTAVDLETGCSSDYENACIYRQLMYRASFALFLVFLCLALAAWFSDYVNRSLWPFKFAVAVTLFIGFWWGENSFFSGWAEFSRAISFIWLLFQGLLIIDFGHDCHDVIMAKADEADSEEEGGGRKWQIMYMIISLGFLCLAGLGLAYLFMNYSGCSLGMFFIMITLIFGLITLVLSLLNQVNKGLLTPCIMFSYSVFMCWYALLSSPVKSCNPTADHNKGHQWQVSIIVMVVITFVILMYCVVNGTVILNLFNVEGEGVMQYQMSSSTKPKPKSSLTTGLTDGTTGENKGLNTKDNESGNAERTSNSGNPDAESGNGGEIEEESGTPQERVFFHILMIFFIIYCTMMLTNWGRTNGNVPGAGDEAIANESMWFKILCQWAFIAMYCKALHVAYLENQ
eukprot:TRINITY_DN61029_c0_g1_i1.p1 TRINITY_DN61029_c0_g1~~TRINITY_DN61029_c0_g1_i1.p1  ORF type:complete len:462 (+),score=-49.82 TRINITY_DN61029_c0_g1_i1:93-1478(+)